MTLDSLDALAVAQSLKVCTKWVNMKLKMAGTPCDTQFPHLRSPMPPPPSTPAHHAAAASGMEPVEDLIESFKSGVVLGVVRLFCGCPLR